MQILWRKVIFSYLKSILFLENDLLVEYITDKMITLHKNLSLKKKKKKNGQQNKKYMTSVSKNEVATKWTICKECWVSWQ